MRNFVLTIFCLLLLLLPAYAFTNLDNAGVFFDNALFPNNSNIGDNSTQNPTDIFYDGLNPKSTQGVTCADTGDANPGTLSFTPSADSVRITGLDSDGCDISITESGAIDGQRATITIFNSAGGTFDITDTTGVTELSGNFSGAVHDSITIEYVNDRWIQVGGSDN